MTYQQTLDYLYHTLPMFSRMGSAAFKKDLTNTQALCTHLDNPQQLFKTFHVGGTNGKGSVSHMLAAILQTAGYKTGLYTSPHLLDFRERIKVDGTMAPEAFVVHFVEKHKTFIEAIKPSFFEITVAMAFQYFAEQQVDVAIIEVGLGGRLDSTNIISPELAVITNISWDHMNMLGDTLQKIAVEKAGIIKKGIPVIIGERQAESASVFETTAAEKNAPLYFASDRFSVSEFNIETDRLQVTVQDIQYGDLKKFELDLAGIYQTKNISTVLQAVEIAKQKGIVLPDAAIEHGLRNTKKLTGLHGRWEVVLQNPTVVLEVAHNKAGIQQMLEHLQHIAYQQLHIIMGFVKDKEVEGVLQLLPKNATFYFTHAHIPRALDAIALQEKAAAFELKGDCYDDVNNALRQALANASEKDLIIVCGSIFLVAEVRTAVLTVQA
jgi:dihydrofolate synthase / folylpolyglutamate synthase